MFEDVNPSGLNPLPSSEVTELSDWKAALRADFESWLETLEQVPEEENDDVEAPEGPETPEVPDLYSFYQQLAAANVEARKANRRTAEAFSQWGETLARFESQLIPLRESAAQLTAAQSRDDELPRAYCLVLVEFLDRMLRLAKAFESVPPQPGWWKGNDLVWRASWKTQRQGFAILLSHLEELLKKEGVTRIEVTGQAFDPTYMTAVTVEADPRRPAQTVLEELAPGYRRRSELLRPAQVKVSVRE